MSVTTLLLFALVTALATGIGVIPFAMFPPVSPERKGISTAIVSGLMAAASLTLVKEGYRYGQGSLVLGLVLGVAFVWASNKFLSDRDLIHLEGFAAADTRKMLLMVGVMTMHSITEGIGIGVAFGDGMELGVFITIAIAVHNIPEGLAIGLVLIPRGVSILQTAWWAVFSSLPQVVLAVPAYLAVEFFRPSLPIGLGFDPLIPQPAILLRLGRGSRHAGHLAGGLARTIHVLERSKRQDRVISILSSTKPASSLQYSDNEEILPLLHWTGR